MTDLPILLSLVVSHGPPTAAMAEERLFRFALITEQCVLGKNDDGSNASREQKWLRILKTHSQLVDCMCSRVPTGSGGRTEHMLAAM